MAIDSTIALISVADAKTQLKITVSTEDTILADIINGCSAAINKFCGRVLLSATYTEYYNGNGTSELILRNFPIISVSSLYNADANREFNSNSQIDVDENVIIQKQSGILKLWNNEGAFLSGYANVKVAYTAGFASGSIPHDIQAAARLLVAQRYMKYQNKRYEVQSQTFGDNTVTYLNESLPEDVRSMLGPYCVPLQAPDFSYAD